MENIHSYYILWNQELDRAIFLMSFSGSVLHLCQVQHCIVFKLKTENRKPNQKPKSKTDFLKKRTLKTNLGLYFINLTAIFLLYLWIRP